MTAGDLANCWIAGGHRPQQQCTKCCNDTKRPPLAAGFE